jgi:hypothetical protein
MVLAENGLLQHSNAAPNRVSEFCCDGKLSLAYGWLQTVQGHIMEINDLAAFPKHIWQTQPPIVFKKQMGFKNSIGS